MKLHELYAVHLHGEDLDALGATELQKSLIHVFESYPDKKTLSRDINNLEKVRKRHLAGVEFCGDVLKHDNARDVRDAKLIELIERGYSCIAASKVVGITDCRGWWLLTENGYKYDKSNGKWIKLNRVSANI